jgi:3-oxoacyl-[acyl-carrier-protein] synthase II
VAAKSYFGNLGAAGGMVELATSLLALEHQHLFATLNYLSPDPECHVAVVTDDEHPSGNSVLNINVTPQGQASAVLVQRFAG